MKRFYLAIFLAMAILFIGASVLVTGQNCPAVKDRVLMYSTEHYLYPQPMGPGFDPFGYNYQAHLFNGYYCNAYLGAVGFPPYEGDTESYLAENPTFATHWTWPYRDDIITMKWNDAWLANTDCDGDGKLDRHYGFPTYIGSGAWLTNHIRGTYYADGKKCEWTYFVKIVAAPFEANLNNGIWYMLDGTEIGPSIWGAFAIIQEVYNDPCARINGLLYISPLGPGFGKF